MEMIFHFLRIFTLVKTGVVSLFEYKTRIIIPIITVTHAPKAFEKTLKTVLIEIMSFVQKYRESSTKIWYESGLLKTKVWKEAHRPFCRPEMVGTLV